MTSAEILPEIMKLSPDDQRFIAESIWLHLEGGPREDRARFDQELERRVAEADEHPETMIPWEEALRQLRGKK